MFNFFNKKIEKREFEQFKQGVQTGLNKAKQDMAYVGSWIKHLDSKNSEIKNEFLNVYKEISTIKEDLEEIKNMLSIIGNNKSFKQPQTLFNKQTPSKSVLNSVQTGVQTAFLKNLTITERAIILVLLNSDMKLSYEDLAAMLGKRKATIRGQINSIKQKSEGLVEEKVCENNKKRVFIPEKTKTILLKTEKVKVKSSNLNKENNE